MSGDIEVSPVSAGDMTALLSLWRGQYDFHYQLDSDYYRPFSSAIEQAAVNAIETALADTEPLMRVARNDGRLCGFVTFDVARRDYIDSRYVVFGEIRELYVSAEFRGRGVGAALIDAVEAHFRERGVNSMLVQCATGNKGAIEFYRHGGYESRQVLLYKRLE